LLKEMAGLAGLMVLAEIAAAPSQAAAELPTAVGGCSETTIKEIGYRLENPNSGTVVQYANGLIQISYDLIAAAHRSKVGDKVKVCLVSVPKNCPPGDDRGKVYGAKNLRTGETWEAPDSQHSCGGA
jgi:hypothetical protein